jgi:hypothetical protein
VHAAVEAGGDAILLGVPAARPGQYKILPLHTAAMQSSYPAVVVILLARGPGGSA